MKNPSDAFDTPNATFDTPNAPFDTPRAPFDNPIATWHLFGQPLQHRGCVPQPNWIKLRKESQSTSEASIICDVCEGRSIALLVIHSFADLQNLPPRPRRIKRRRHALDTKCLQNQPLQRKYKAIVALDAECFYPAGYKLRDRRCAVTCLCSPWPAVS